MEAQRVITDNGGAIIEDISLLPLPNIVISLPVTSNSAEVILGESPEKADQSN